MPDNTALNLASTAGDLIATDELTTINGAAAPAGLKVQRSKVGFGADGAFTDASATNPVPTVALQHGLISAANSSAVALAAGGVFTGTAEDVTEFADIRIAVFADQASAADGLQIQQSSNGTNWDILDAYAVPASNGKTFSVATNAKFMRVVYTNGATAQTAFRLQVKIHKSYSKGSSVRPQDARTNDNDQEEVLAHLMGYNGASWDRLRSTLANGLAVDVTRLPAVPELRAATLHITSTALVNTVATCTLPAPPAGQFHYITSIQLVKLYAALGVAAGAGVVIASANLPGTPSWTTEQAAGAIGTAPRVIDYQPTTPLKSAAAAVAVTLVAPAQLQTIWRWNVSYFTAA